MVYSDPDDYQPTAGKLPDFLGDQLGYLSSRAHWLFHQGGNAALAPLDLNVKHYGLLTVIAQEGPLSQGRLGEIMRIDRTTMVAFVDELEELGYVVRGRNPEDRRAYALSITPEGRKVQKRAAAAMKKAQGDVVAALSPEEQLELARLLRTIVESPPSP